MATTQEQKGMDNTEKARNLINKHLDLHGGGGLGITDGDVYRAVLDAVCEALTVKSFPNDEDVKAHLNSLPYYGTCNTEYDEGFEDGVKWLKEKMTE